jgi:hypothetical protein
MHRRFGPSLILVAWLATAGCASDGRPRDQLSTETGTAMRLLVVDPIGTIVTPRVAPDLSVYVDDVLSHVSPSGEYWVPKRTQPYSVSLRIDSFDDRQILIFNWIGMTSPAPRVTLQREPVPTLAVNASVRLVNERGEPYMPLASERPRRLLFAFEDRDVEVAYFNRSDWKADANGVIHLSALSFRTIAHVRGRIHVIEFHEAEGLPNVPQWIVATGSSDDVDVDSEAAIHTIVMKPAESQTLVRPRVRVPPWGGTPSSIDIMLRAPTLGVARVQETTTTTTTTTTRPSTPEFPLIAIAPPQSGLQTTIVAEAKLPDGGIGRAWHTNLDPTHSSLSPEIDFAIPEEVILTNPPDGATVPTDFEWKPTNPPSFYKLTAACKKGDKTLFIETFTTKTSASIRDIASYDCDWRVQTIPAATSIDQLASTDGWQARQFEENKFESGVTSISATRHIGAGAKTR